MSKCEECFIETSERFCRVCQEKIDLHLDKQICNCGGCGASIPLAEWTPTGDGGFTAICACGLDAGVVRKSDIDVSEWT